MKRILTLTAVVVFAAGIAYAGDYHFGTSLVCTDCHTMHAQQSHSYSGVAGFQSWGPTEFLLKGDSISGMCLGCHDNNNGYPDVMRLDGGAGTSTGRSGGALNQAALLEGYADWMGHTIGATAAAPGLTGSFVPAATGFSCLDCHLQHGRNQTGTVFNATESVNPYRNLKQLGASGSTITISYNRDPSTTSNPNGAFSATNILTRDVFETFPNDYEKDDVNLNEPNITNSGYGAWCTKCHVGFHGAVGGPEVHGVAATVGYEEFIRHPNSTVNIGEVRVGTSTSSGGHSGTSQFLGTPYRVRVMSPTGEWGPIGATWTAVPGTTDKLTPTCLSCHKGHGSTRAFGLIYALGNAALGENGDGTAQKQLCRQCHVQGVD